ncbi:universal stress protein [Chryseolinea lacunae]|uniref:Universal stress protein n=1 Tax=Chryseolinea lacunae TaxID=2801331 RepID=A0ABS1KL68_9BACT|nr:universal stress protein [Chryseolinea lacunae]MBL0740201.1 universal stress protein [Chryseolinea lacunae]
MQKILVPCDFSEQTHPAVALALELKQRSGGQVHLLHVVEPPLMHDTLVTPSLTFDAALLTELQDQSENYFAELLSKHGNNRFVTKTDFGPVFGVIQDYIRTEHIDLVVLGTKGAHGITAFLVGTHAEKIVRDSPCPVVAVKKHEVLATMRDIVFPNALEEGQEDLVLHVKALQHFLGARLHVVRINTPDHFVSDAVTQDRLQAFATHHMLKDFTLHVYNDKSEAAGIINFTHSINGNIIAMGTHGRHGLNHLLSGSVAEDVVNRVDCAIWTYAMNKKA